MVGLEFFLARRYLGARYKERFVSIVGIFAFIGITLGVATLIIVTAVMNGFRHELMTRIVGLNGHLGVFSTSGYMAPERGLEEKIRKVEGTRCVYPFAERQALVMRGGLAAGILVQGFAIEDFINRPILKEKGLLHGAWSNLETPNSLVIGVRLAERLGAKVGDTVTLIAPQGELCAIGMVPRLRTFTIVGIFDVAMHEYNANFAFTKLQTAQAFFHMRDAISGYQLFFNSPEEALKAQANVRATLSGREDITIFDWRQANATFFRAIAIQRNVMVLVLSLIVLVAAFNIVATLVMMVQHKRHEIAILRTLGVSKGAVMRIFCLCGSALGVGGTFGGTALGIVITYSLEPLRRALESMTGNNLFPQEIYYLTTLPTRLEMSEVWIVVGIAILLSFLATLYPAWRASSIDPVQSLREGN